MIKIKMQSILLDFIGLASYTHIKKLIIISLLNFIIQNQTKRGW